MIGPPIVLHRANQRVVFQQATSTARQVCRHRSLSDRLSAVPSTNRERVRSRPRFGKRMCAAVLELEGPRGKRIIFDTFVKPSWRNPVDFTRRAWISRPSPFWLQDRPDSSASMSFATFIERVIVWSPWTSAPHVSLCPPGSSSSCATSVMECYRHGGSTCLSTLPQLQVCDHRWPILLPTSKQMSGGPCVYLNGAAR